MTDEQKRTAPAATGDGPSNLDGYTRIIAPNSLEAQAMEAITKLQQEQDKKAMGNIAKAFTREEWQTVLEVAPPQILADVLARKAIKGERIAQRINEVYEEENKKWK